MMDLSHYHALADFFDYPDEAFLSRIHTAQIHLLQHYPEAARESDLFVSLLPHSLKDRQELYTRSFDVQSVTPLDIGYVLFGDDYKRAELLVHLSREHKKADNDCRKELVDHLSNVLRLISKWEDRSLVNEFVEEMLEPALKKMISEFDPARLKTKNEIYRKHYKTLIEPAVQKATAYSHALKTLDQVIQKDFTLKPKTELAQTSDFLKSIERELAIADDVKPQALMRGMV